jgi:hypothetical protein
MSTPNRMLIGKERNSARAMLRKALKQGRLHMRRTYYDHYDSCHAPIETPNATFELINDEYSLKMFERMLKAGGDSISVLPNGMYSLWTGYSTYEVCTTDQLSLLAQLVSI